MSNSSEFSSSGVPILRHKQLEREFQSTSYVEDKWLKRIETHADKYLGEAESVFHELVSDHVHIDVHVVRPTPERNYYTLYTTGMSALAMNTPEDAQEYEYAELVMCLPPDWPLLQEELDNSENYWPIRWLKTMARLPHDYDTWLSWGHTVPNGDPALPLSGNTDMCAFIVLPPLEVHEDFLTLDMEDGQTVHFYAILPIYLEELEHKLEYGLDALLDQFEAHHVNEILDLSRMNTCADV
ncbi:suppressor of fused domain protein [Paenibacillus barcinonensis]|uniref:Suppressor of fused domain protein n=1 Tax=Paenibacillus barcinonensis TaxID=198119 RepID=A0A2V4V5U1_PAEBA|nr:suppressor of fused domain protein [Paenibacillus barcinonensis]PYE47663.1 suppressor of fused protein SUFU [Paenibacillus barcinonensis]QKS58532.1 suppressor of fused domain protein [Paenibacillus barcinonensis]